jgi:hypothetical protein
MKKGYFPISLDLALILFCKVLSNDLNMQITAVLSDYDGTLCPTGSIRLYFWNLEAVCVEVSK